MAATLTEALKDPDVLYSLRHHPGGFRFNKMVEVVVALEDWWPHVGVEATGAGGEGGGGRGGGGGGEGGGGEGLSIRGPMANLLNLLATGLNFTYRLKTGDRSWGTKREDGTWTGMIGMVVNKEADLALGPLAINEERAEVVSFTTPVFYNYLTMLATRINTGVDPWAFLNPLSLAVWGALLGTLGVLWAMSVMLTYPNSSPILVYGTLLRILLQQAVPFGTARGRVRVVVGPWMILAVVIVWSYSGHLVSMMTIQPINYPIQNAWDLVKRRDLTALMQHNTAYTALLKASESGELHALDGLRSVGRMRYVQIGYEEWMNLTRTGRFVTIQDFITLQRFVADEFSSTGLCNQYVTPAKFIHFTFSMALRKGSPLLPAVNARLRGVVEGGLYDYWLSNSVPNHTACTATPSSRTGHQSFSIRTLAGVFLVLGVGLLFSVVIFCMELAANHLTTRKGMWARVYVD